MDLDTATLAELQAEFVRLGNELSKIDSKRRKILRRIESKKSSAAATVRPQFTSYLYGLDPGYTTVDGGTYCATTLSSVRPRSAMSRRMRRIRRMSASVST